MTFIVLLVFVDDTIIASNNTEHVERLKKMLDSRFKLEDLGNLKYFLSLEVARSKKGISLSQRHYALQRLSNVDALGYKLRTIPMVPNIKLSTKEGDLLEDPTTYRRLIEKLLYLTITRPDLPYSVERLSQFLSRPRGPHMEAAQQVLRYIKGSMGQGIFFVIFFFY